MADRLILIDTSILIEYYRKTDKSNSVWFSLVQKGYEFAVSVITKYEIFSGATPAQLNFWESIFQTISVIPLDEVCVDTAVQINGALKRKRKQLDIADLLIGSTAITRGLHFATLNRKHFERIDELVIID